MRGAWSATRVFFVRDLGSYFWPHHLWLKRTLLGGQLPFWDPNPGLGYPAAADPALQVFFLPTLLLRVLLPDVVGFNLCVALPLPIAALGLFTLARRHVSAPAAALGGVVYASSGILASATNCTNLAWCAALAPWLLWAADRLARRATAVRLAAVAGLVALGVCAGEPVTLAATVALAAALVFATHHGRGRLAHTAFVLGGAALGAALAAIQLLPLAAVTSRSIRGAGLLLDSWSLHPLRLVEAVVPTAFGDYLGLPAEVGPWLAPLDDGRSPYFFSLYLGLPALILAALGACLGRPRRHAWFCAAVTLVFLVVSFGSHTPLHGALRAVLPPFRVFRYPTKYALLAALGVALLAALGWDAVRAMPRLRSRPPALPRLLILASLGSAALVGLVLFVGWSSAGARAAAGLARQLGLHDSAAAAAFLAGRMRSTAARTFAVSAAVPLCLWVAVSRRRESRVALAALFAAVALDVVSAGTGLNPTIAAAALGPPPWVARTQESADGRVFVPRELLPGSPQRDPDVPAPPPCPPNARPVELLAVFGAALPAFPSAWGVRDTIGEDLTGLRPRAYLDLLLRYAAADRQARTRMLRRSGTRYHILPRPPSVEARLVEKLPIPSGFALFDDPAAAPRLALVPRARVAPDAEEQIAALFAPGFEPSEELLVDQDPGPAGTSGAANVEQAEIVSEDRSRLHVRATSRAAAYLLVLDGFDPGWTASVDGGRAPLLRANGLFRAVHLAAGTHDVVFAYRPPSLLLGAGLSGVTAAGLLGACLASRRRDPRRRTPAGRRGAPRTT